MGQTLANFGGGFGAQVNPGIEIYAKQAGEMNVLASRHFNAGQRGIFFAVGYLGCFVGPETLILTTTLVLLVLIRRQYFSKARDVAISIIDAKKAAI